MEWLPDESLEPPTTPDSHAPTSPAPAEEPAPPPLLPRKPVAGLLPSRTAGSGRGLALFGGIEQVLDTVDAIADRIAEVTGIRSLVR